MTTKWIEGASAKVFKKPIISHCQFFYKAALCKDGEIEALNKIKTKTNPNKKPSTPKKNYDNGQHNMQLSLCSLLITKFKRKPIIVSVPTQPPLVILKLTSFGCEVLAPVEMPEDYI